MRRANSVIAPAALALVIALAGCGSTDTPARTAVSRKLPPTTKVVAVRLTSPAVHGGRLSALYTCDGKDVSPPLKWGPIPSNLHELALFAIGLARSSSGKVSRTIEWGMAGVTPTLHGLAAGEVPKGGFLVQTSDGKKTYSICPSKGQTERYEFALYALPELIRASPQISGARLLGNLTGKIPQGRSPAEGVFTATYTRP